MISQKLRIVLAVLIPFPGLALAPVIYVGAGGAAQIKPAEESVDCPQGCGLQVRPSVEGLPHAFENWQLHGLDGLLPSAASVIQADHLVAGFAHEFPEVQILRTRLDQRSASGNSGTDAPLRLASLEGGWAPSGYSGDSGRRDGGGHNIAAHSSSSSEQSTGGNGIEDIDSPEGQPSADGITDNEIITAELIDDILNDTPYPDTDYPDTDGNVQPASIENPAVAVPEPGTLALLSMGLIAMGISLRRRKTTLVAPHVS